MSSEQSDHTQKGRRKTSTATFSKQHVSDSSVLPESGFVRAALQANEFESMFEAMSDGMCIYDSRGTILRMNTALRNMLGHTAAAEASHESDGASTSLQFIGDPEGRLMPKEDWPVSRILQGEVLVGGQEDIMVCLPDGRDILLNVSGAPIRAADGTIVGAITAMRDVTTRRWLEMRTQDILNSLLAMAETLVETPMSDPETSKPVQEASQKIGQRLVELAREVLGCLRIGIASIDPNTGIMQPIAVAGLSEQHERQWWLNQQHSRLNDYFNPSILARLFAGEEVLLDFPQQASSSHSSYGARTLLIVPLREGDHLIGILSIEQSVTKHEFSAEEIQIIRATARLIGLITVQERLRVENTRIQASELALREINRRMNEFLSIASHELRTPLTIIQTSVQLSERQLKRLLLRGDVQLMHLESFKEQLEQTSSQIGHMNQLVSSLLEVSRIQEGRLEVHPVPANLVTLVNEVLNELRLTTPRQILLEMSAIEAIPVVIDTNRIKQVLLNYLTNALKYSPEHAAIEVSLKQEGHEAIVAVRDQGKGLTAEEQANIWERFYRLERDTSVEGLGLGLYICQAIMQQHQGRWGVQSAPGKGSTFWFALPEHPSENPAPY